MTFSLAIVFILSLIFSGSVFAGKIPEQDYFDQKFSALERSASEIKGDTTQIVSILGNVLEGTVPAGGNLTRLCNEKGWNLIVLMGHNGISNPNVVVAGSCFGYPKTAEEFQQALAKGKPLYDAWLKNQSTTFRVNRIKVDTVEIDELNVRVATFKEKLEIKDMQIDKLQIRLVEITEKLSVKKVEIDELEVKVANFEEVNIDNLNIKDAEIENLRIENLRVKNALIDNLRIKQLAIDNLNTLLATAQKCISVYESRPIVIQYAPGVCTSGVCDERSFTGNVPMIVLKHCSNGADAIEVQERCNKEQRFKGKRVRIKKSGIANPMAWLRDKSCIRTYSKNPLTQADLQALLLPEEILIKIEEYQDGVEGKHKTIAVYAILLQ